MPEANYTETLGPVEPKPTNWPRIILVAVLGSSLLIGAAYAGYWYGAESSKFKSQSSKPQTKTQNQVTPTPTPTPPLAPAVEDETKDWKTYTNIFFGYLIKYPSDWTVTEERVSQGELARQSFRTAELDFNKTAAEVTLAVVTEKPSFERLKSIGVISAGSPAVFGNVNGTLYESEGIGVGGSGYRMDFVFEKDNKVFWIYLVTGLGNETLHKMTFNQILSTFKFLD